MSVFISEVIRFQKHTRRVDRECVALQGQKRAISPRGLTYKTYARETARRRETASIWEIGSVSFTLVRDRAECNHQSMEITLKHTPDADSLRKSPERGSGQPLEIDLGESPIGRIGGSRYGRWGRGTRGSSGGKQPPSSHRRHGRRRRRRRRHRRRRRRHRRRGRRHRCAARPARSRRRGR